MSISSQQSDEQPTKKAQGLRGLPNGYQINQYFQRYLRTQYILAGSLMINIILSVYYVEFSMRDLQQKRWFLHAGTYFTLLCSNYFPKKVALLILNSKVYHDYRVCYESVEISSSMFKLGLETIVLLIRPYSFLEDIEFELATEPFSNFDQQFHFVNHLLTVGGLSQSFIIFNIIFNTSHLKSDRSNRICRMYDCRPSNMYVIRAWFKRHYLLKLFSILIFWLFTCTLCFRIAEYRYNIHVESLWNAFWLTFSTMFCLGFGDVFPQTKFGRCIAFITMYTGVVFTYFSITLIKRILKLNSNEKRTLTLLNGLKKKSELHILASEYLKQSLPRVWRNYKNRDFGLEVRQTIHQIHLKKRMQAKRLQTRKIYGSNSVYNEFVRNFDKTSSNIDSLKYNNDKLIEQGLKVLDSEHLKKYLQTRNHQNFNQPGNSFRQPFQKRYSTETIPLFSQTDGLES